MLLDFGGVPLVVLAARRAANTGRNVLVATSIEQTDDCLASTVSKHGLECHRGSLDDVLGRFVDALHDYEEDTLVFRLTADNVIPDGQLLDEIETDFLSRNLEYLSCGCGASGLPYGISAEIMRLRSLREADVSTQDAFDREHVTPWIRRKYGQACFERYRDLHLSHYRCTIDCLDDYLFVRELFQNIRDPFNVPYLELVEKLRQVSTIPIISQPATKLVLGTAQMGMAYGIANSIGQPDAQKIREIIRIGILNGVQSIDTARAYGNSENMVGAALTGGWQGRVRVVTKLAPLNYCPPDASEDTVRAFAEASFFQSLSALAGQTISALLLHRAAELNMWDGALRRTLIRWRSEGRIETFGVSVQDRAELVKALEDDEIGHIQLPYNLLDGRWDSLIPRINDAKKGRELTIHVRSVFLQGLLTSRNPDHWRCARVDDPQGVLDWLDTTCCDLERETVSELCIAFAASQPWIDGIVVGMEKLDQLRENLHYFEKQSLSQAEVHRIQTTRPNLDETTLNPAFWQRD